MNITDGSTCNTASRRQRERARSIEIAAAAARIGAKRIDGHRWKCGRKMIGARMVVKLGRAALERSPPKSRKQNPPTEGADT